MAPKFQACCAHDHDCEAAECGPAYSLYKHVDLTNVSGPSHTVPWTTVHVCTRTPNHPLTHSPTRTHTHTHTHMHTQARTHAHTSTHARAHTQKHAQTPTRFLSLTAYTGALLERGHTRHLPQCTQVLGYQTGANSSSIVQQ